ncbi:MAG: helix-turn-helix transcriptional regulator [Thermoanaerobaculia bacterium]
MRQAEPTACPPLSKPVHALCFELASGARVPLHFHPEDQLVYASRGTMTVRTGDATWVVPPQRAVWIPAYTPHAIDAHDGVSMRTLYLRSGLVRHLGGSCRVVHVSALLRELVLEACRYVTLERRSAAQAHLIDLLIDQLEVLEASPLVLPDPTDPRALRLARLLEADPGDSRSLDELCRAVGASRRTIERLFVAETRMTLGDWRQQARLAQALRLLAAGETVTRVAHEAGYATASAFISMFRRALGTTPRRYFAGPREPALPPPTPEPEHRRQLPGRAPRRGVGSRSTSPPLPSNLRRT